MGLVVNDLKNYPNGHELIEMVNNGEMTLEQAAVEAVKAQNEEQEAKELFSRVTNRNNSQKLSNKEVAENIVKDATARENNAKELADLINKNRGGVK